MPPLRIVVGAKVRFSSAPTKPSFPGEALLHGLVLRRIGFWQKTDLQMYQLHHLLIGNITLHFQLASTIQRRIYLI